MPNTRTPSQVVRDFTNSPIRSISNNNQTQTNSNDNRSPSQVVRDAINDRPLARSVQNEQRSSTPVQGPVQPPRRRSSSSRSSSSSTQTPSQVVQQEITRPFVEPSQRTPSRPSGVEQRVTQRESINNNQFTQNVQNSLTQQSQANRIGTLTDTSRVPAPINPRSPINTPTQQVQITQSSIISNPNLSRVERVRQTDFSQLAREIETNTNTQNRFLQDENNRRLASFGIAALGTAQQTGGVVRNFATNPVQTSISGITNVGDFIRNPANTVTAVRQDFATNPVSALGNLAGGVGVGTAATSGARAISSGARNQFVAIGSRRVDLQDLTTPDVISGRQQFPLTRSTSESIESFRRADNVVSTASPTPLSGNIAGQSRKGAFGLEDGGIFVTPADRTSIVFTGATANPQTTFSFNPLAGIRTTTPTITTIQTQGVVRQPRDIVTQPGFRPTQEFLRTQAGTGQAFITKRSEIGQGEIPRQRFTADMDFNAGFRLPVQRDGQTIRTADIRTGDRIREAGTRELEAVIPEGSRINPRPPQTIAGRIKGFDEFTTINGRNVAIRRADLDVSTPISTSNIPTRTSRTSSRTIPQQRIQRETSALRSELNNLQVRSPTPGALSGVSALQRGQSSQFSAVSTRSNIVTPSSISGLSTQSRGSPFSDFGGSSSTPFTPSGFSGGGSGSSGGSSFTPSGFSGGGSGGSFFSLTPSTPVQPQNFRLPSQGGGGSGGSVPFQLQRDGGRFVSSLGGAITGFTSRNPTPDQSGLKIRPIKIR